MRKRYIWVLPALAADDARGGDEEDRGGENEQDAEAGEDSDHLFYKVESDKLVVEQVDKVEV